MIPARPLVRSSLPRAARSVRARAPARQHIRCQSSASAANVGSSSGGSSHLIMGLAGGVLGSALFYGIYSYTPAGQAASKLNKAAKEAEQKYLVAARKLQQQTPSAEQAVQSIKEFAYSYVGWIPGGRAYVDKAFEDWEKIRENHKDEADDIVSEAYKKFQDISRSGLSIETATRAYDALAELSKKVASLAGDALSDLIDNHPQVKEKLGGSVDQLKDLGEKYGPEAKKKVDETWKQVKDILAGGVGLASLDKVRKLLEDKVAEVKKLGDEAWKKGLEEAKPLLDKNPKVKELVESNADALRQGNVAELFSKAKKAVESGSLGELDEYVKKAVEQARSKGSAALGSLGGGDDDGWVQIDKYMKMLPQGDDILSKLKQLGEVAEEHKVEGEKLFQETVEELKKVLEEKSQKAQEIAKSAKKNVK